MNGTFGIDDVLTALGLNNALANYELQKADSTDGSSYAKRIGSLGDVLEERAYNRHVEHNFSATIKAAITGDVKIRLGGKGYAAVDPKFVLTRIQVSQVSQDFPDLSVTCHQHPDSTSPQNVHTARGKEITLPKLDWGITNALSLSDSTLSEDLIRVVWSATIQHKDRLSRSGEFLIGASYDLLEEEEIECYDGATVTMDAAWSSDPVRISKNNEGFVTKVLKHHRHLTLDVLN